MNKYKKLVIEIEPKLSWLYNTFNNLDKSNIRDTLKDILLEMSKYQKINTKKGGIFWK